jgi:hypothetical protein
MKYILILLTLSLGSCSGKEEAAFPNLVLEKNLELVLFKNGRESDRRVLAFNEEEETSIKAWMESFADLKKKDNNSYAPAVLLLGKRIKVNFQKGATIISLKEEDDPKALWKQYSRVPTEQDKEIMALLEHSK